MGALVKDNLAACRPLSGVAARSRRKSGAAARDPVVLESSIDRFRDHPFADLFLDGPCAAVILDPGGRLCDCNPAFRALVGHKRVQATPHPFAIYVDRASLTDYLKHLRDGAVVGHPVSAAISVRGPGDEVVPVRFFSTFTREHGRKHYSTVIIDDSDRQLAMLKAEREHRAYHELINSLDAIVWEMDGETGHITYLSRKAETLFGRRSPEWDHSRGFRWSELHVDDRERVLNELVRAVATRRDFVTEYRAFTLERELIWLQDSVTIHTVNGHLKVRGVAVDITDRKMAEAQAVIAAAELERRVDQRTEELRWTISELESFSYTLSHDMRAPLRSIEGYASLVEEAMNSKEPINTKDCLRRIMRSTQRLDSLIQDVLKYGALAKEPVELKELDLNAIVPAIAEEAPGFKVPGAKIEVADNLLPVIGHEGFLSQCLSNLLSNAGKFVEPGVAPGVRIWTEREGEFVRLYVADDGIGIASEDHLRIFKVFERCHRNRAIEGSGLGLAVVERAAERMGGTVGVESAPGKGSKFWIQLGGVQ